MKLLIDIDEKKYEDIKRIAKAQFELTDKTEAQIIADGIPYEPKGDLISRSDVLKAVDNRHKELLHDTVYSSKDCQIDLLGIKKHILAIPPADTIVNTIEVRPQGEWIPVSERLPEDRENTYWVCTDGEYQCQCRWTNVNPFWTNLKTDWHWCHFDIPRYQEVTAWRPLPKYYESEVDK